MHEIPLAIFFFVLCVCWSQMMCGSYRAVSNPGRSSGVNGEESKHFNARINLRCFTCVNQVAQQCITDSWRTSSSARRSLNVEFCDGWRLMCHSSTEPSSFCCINCNAAEMCKSTLLPTVGNQFPDFFFFCTQERF